MARSRRQGGMFFNLTSVCVAKVYRGVGETYIQWGIVCMSRGKEYPVRL